LKKKRGKEGWKKGGRGSLDKIQTEGKGDLKWNFRGHGRTGKEGQAIFQKESYRAERNCRKKINSHRVGAPASREEGKHWESKDGTKGDLIKGTEGKTKRRRPRSRKATPLVAETGEKNQRNVKNRRKVCWGPKAGG